MLEPYNTQRVIGASFDDVYDFLMEPMNLPKWAVEFCKGIEKEGDGYRVSICDGSVMWFKVTGDRALGLARIRWR